MNRSACAARAVAASLSLAWTVLPLGEAAAAFGQEEANVDRVEDPDAPQVRALEPVDAPAAEDHPGLTFHAPPKALAGDARTEDWPAFLGPRRDGRTRETRLLREWGAQGPELVWEMERGEGFACPVVAGGRVVFTHREGDEAHVDCLEAETGRRYWRFSFPCDYEPRYIRDGGPRSTPAVSDGLVYVHGVQGRLFCLELETGRVVWQRDLAREMSVPDGFFGVVASPLVHGEHLILNVGAPDGPCVAAFDKRTGRMVWGAGKEWGRSCASPVVAELDGRERVLVLAGGESRPPTGGLLALDAESGALLGEYPFRSRTYESVSGASPIVGGGRIFLTASYGTGTAALALRPEGGLEELWKTRRLGIQFATPVYEDGHLYVIDGVSDRAGALVCVDAASGEERARTDLTWEEEDVEYGGERRTLPLSVGEGSLLAADGDLLCLGDNGHLLWLAATPEGAEVVARAWLFRANQSWTPPVVSRGLLYVCQNRPERFGDEPARLLCFDLRAGG